MTRRLLCALIAPVLALALAGAAEAAGELKFTAAPALPSLPTVTLTAKAQTAAAAMGSFSVSDTTTAKKGWNVTVAGQSGTGKSAVFARYCPKAKCGTDSEGYVAGGATLPAGSLTLNSTGASFTGGSGTAPSLLCSSPCAVDAASAVKIASAPSGTEGTWTASGFSSGSLTLNIATTTRALPTEEVYRVNILWTLSSGP